MRKVPQPHKTWTVKKLRQFEARLAKDFRRGLINAPLHLSGGNEEQLIEVFKDIRAKDWVVSTHRNHYHYLLKGGKPDALYAEIVGDVGGPCHGAGRSMHVYDTSIRFITSGIVAGGCAIACGLGLGIHRKKGSEHVWCFIGDGAEDSGHYLEAARYCECMDLPVTFVIEDNGLSIETTKDHRWGVHMPVPFTNTCRYTYKRLYPHVGIGEHVTF